ncbi:hypothetical protein ABIA58_005929 [Pseudomonas frederiksbergensis]|jgi:hypothetical protein
MHLLAVNYYVHYPFTSPVNPKDKVKSIANTLPFNLYFLAFFERKSARSVLRTA